MQRNAPRTRGRGRGIFTFESFSLIIERVLGRFLMGQLEIFNFDTIGSEGKRV